MKKSILLICSLFTLTVSASSLAANGPFGVGVVAGEPTGISSKLYLGESRVHALDAGFGWSLTKDHDFSVIADYLYHNYNLIQVKSGELPVYFGLGGRALFRDGKDDKYGIRVPLGLDYQFAAAPWDIFVEIGPVLNVSPDVNMGFTGGGGFRYFF